MSLPTLPTDNLYKFLAVFGLIILVFTVWIYVSYSEKINQETTKLNLLLTEYHAKQETGLIELKASNQLWVDEFGMNLELLDTLEIDTNKIGITESLVLMDFYIKHKSNNDSLITMLTSLRDILYPIKQELKLLDGKIQCLDELLETRKSFFNLLRRFYWFGTGLGLILMIFGFNMWYFLYQKPLDKETRDRFKHT